MCLIFFVGWIFLQKQKGARITVDDVLKLFTGFSPRRSQVILPFMLEEVFFPYIRCNPISALAFQFQLSDYI